MNTYLVRFFYNTDLRWEEEIEASSSLAAFTLAHDRVLDKYGINEWCIERGLLVEIRLKD